MARVSVNSIEKLVINNAIKHLKAWASNSSYYGGGVESTNQGTRANEDLKLAKQINQKKRLVSTTKLNKILKQVNAQRNEQAMYADVDTLKKLIRDTKKLI